MARILTEEEKEIVRINRAKEKEIRHYQYAASQRMKPRKCKWKMSIDKSNKY